MAYDPYGFAATEQRQLTIQREHRRELEQRVCPPAVMESAIYIVEFRHPYFGWLNYKHEFQSREAAEYWREVSGGKAYPTRVRAVT